MVYSLIDRNRLLEDVRERLLPEGDYARPESWNCLLCHDFGSLSYDHKARETTTRGL